MQHIMLGSVIKANKKNYSQTLLEEWKKMENLTKNGLNPSSSDESDSESDNESDNGSDNDESNNEFAKK